MRGESDEDMGDGEREEEEEEGIETRGLCGPHYFF
jgi:hypothetical protein